MEKRPTTGARLRLLVVGLVCFGGYTAQATNYFVAPTGNDGASGAAVAPWQTLQKAATAVVDGDTVVVRSGTYAGFTLTTSGTVGAPITFLADPGTIIASKNTTTADGINLQGANYVTLDGFTVSNGGGITRAGIRTAGNHHVAIRNCSSDSCGAYGILAAASDTLVLDTNSCSRTAGYGIYLDGGCLNPLLRGNRCYTNANCGIYLNGDLAAGGSGLITGAVIERNLIYDNGASEGTPSMTAPAVGNTSISKRYYRSNGMEMTAMWDVSWLSSTALIGCATDIGGIRSADGGKTWSFNCTNLNQNTTYCARKHPVTGVSYACLSTIHDMYHNSYLQDSMIDNGTGRIVYSIDDGATWSLLHDFGKPVLWIAFDPKSQTRAYAAVVDHSHSLGGIYITNNLDLGAASTWTKVTSPPRTEGHPYYIEVLNDGTVVATYSGRREENANGGAFTASSGVFVSTDQGTTWADHNTAGMSYWTHDLIVDPNDATQKTWYACVFRGWGTAFIPGGSSGGVYRTTDRGVSWTQIASSALVPGQVLNVESGAFDPNHPHTFYFTTETEGLWYTADITATSPVWTNVTSYTFLHPVRVRFNPYNPREMWVSSMGNAYQAGQVTSAGPPTCWEPRGVGGGGTLFAPSINPYNPSELFVATDMGDLFHSRNGGRDWAVPSFHMVEGNRGAAVRYTNDPNLLWILNYSPCDGAFSHAHPSKSTDGGTTWTNPTSNWDVNVTASELYVDYDNPNRLIVCGDANAVFFSGDGGATYTKKITDSGNGLALAGVFFDGTTIYVSTNKGLYVSTDNGSTFPVLATTGIPGTEYPCSFAGGKINGSVRLFCLTNTTLLPDLVFGYSTAASIYLLDLSTSIWSPGMTGIAATARPRLLCMAQNDNSTVYACGSNSNANAPTVYKTTNAGASWTSVFSTTNNANIICGWAGQGGDTAWGYARTACGATVCPTNPNYVMVTDTGFCHVSTDGGTTWTQVYTTLVPANQPGCVPISGTGINLDGVQSSAVRSNVLYNNHKKASIAAGQFSGAAGPSGVSVYNNTIDIPTDAWGGLLVAQTCGPNLLRNNVLYLRQDGKYGIVPNLLSDEANLTSDYNFFYGSTSIGYQTAQSAWQAKGFDAHSFFGIAPAVLFVNPTATDYHLLGTAPAINAGDNTPVTGGELDMDGNSRRIGSTVDIGAYEYNLKHPYDANGDFVLSTAELRTLRDAWTAGTIQDFAADSFVLWSLDLWKAGQYHFDPAQAGDKVWRPGN